jgi:HK97 family phage portal protein
MNDTSTWYDADKVGQKHSVILTNWKKDREMARQGAVIQNADSGIIRSSDPAVLELFGITGGKTTVNSQTAQRLSAVGACIGLIGGSVAGLPLHHYKTVNDQRTRIHSHIWDLLNRSPIANWPAASMYEWWVRCNGLRGDAVSEIIRDRNGDPKAIRPHHPDRVEIKLTDSGDDLIYIFTPIGGRKPYALASDDVIHIPGNGYDGHKSLSVIQHDAKQAITIGLAAGEYSAKFFENGGMPKHLFKSPHKMSPDQTNDLRKTYDERYAGPANAGRPMVLTEGLDVTELSMTSIDAELLDSRKYSVIEIARAWRVPPVMIGAQDTTSSWGTGIEQVTLGFVKFTLQPYLTRIEQEINRKLIRKPDEFVEFNLKGLLRGDTKAENESLRQARGGSQGPGWLTLNEIRRIDNLPPITGGDVIYEPKGALNVQKTPAAD